jgi:NAD(P)-dependent dehydrogenase (short-subunit alcohol dehydrogenase family)
MIPDVSDRSIAELISLDGRVAVVTGGAKGTGLAIAGRLAEAGASVVVTDADQDAADAAARGLASDGRRVVGIGLTAGDEAATVALIDKVVERLARLDIWVNNAGVYPRTPMLEMSGVEWDEVLDHNLRASFLGAREAAKRMVAGGTGGIIVNIVSTSAFRASAPGMAHYVASKFGVRGLTQAMAVELGPLGIRVLGVAPTFTVTERTRARLADLDDDAFAAYVRSVGERKPLGRVGAPDDIARAVLFCASDLSLLMTDSTLAVDAGDLAG